MQGVSQVDILSTQMKLVKKPAVKVQEMCDIAEILHKNVKIPVALVTQGNYNITK